MKTTIDIPDKLLEDVMEYTASKTKRAAVVMAMEDYTRRQKVARFLKEAYGAIPDFPTNDEIEAGDMEREEHLRKLWDR